MLESISKVELQQIEDFADAIFATVGIDIEFTKHFLYRLNSRRNKDDIQVSELTSLFNETYVKHGRAIKSLGDNAQAVLKDLQKKLNMPFVLEWDSKSGMFVLTAKTIMRKDNFKTTNTVLTV